MVETAVLGERLRGGFGAGMQRESAALKGYQWLKQHIGTIPRDVGVIITEADVIEGAGIGRTPAREALLRLELEGHLQIIPRKGIYIAPVSDAEVKHLIESRRVVERWSAEEVVFARLLDAEELTSLIDEQEREATDRAGFIEADRRFHRTIVTAVGNPIMSSFYEALRDRQVRIGLAAVSHSESRLGEVLEEHRAIAAAIAAGDPDATRDAVDAHLDRTLTALHWHP